jgi:thiol-disulfide isomerase/thioredoxin
MRRAARNFRVFICGKKTIMSIATISAKDLPRVIASKKGKVVVINFWATWCGPCKKEFPSLVQLAQKYKGKLELITIACDEQKDIKKAEAFLAGQKALNSGAFLNKDAQIVEEYLKFLDPKATDAGIPRTYIFNTKGKLVGALINEQTLAKFDAAVKPHLK